MVHHRLNVEALLGGDFVVDAEEHPFLIIISQDCDLDWDFTLRNDENAAGEHKLLPNIMFCEAVSIADLRDRGINAELWRRVRENKDERYQYLRSVEPAEDRFVEGIPELGIDFKRYFSIPTEEVYAQLTLGGRRRTRLLTPYSEHFVNRFHHFQQRIALPEDHFLPPR